MSLGQAQPVSRIQWTESNGELSVAWTSTQMFVQPSDQGDYQFKVVIVGDNDEDLDCAHQG